MFRLSLGPLNRPLRAVRRQFPPWNFITIHYFYFIVTCLVSGLILWGSATPFRSLTFVDSLFLAVSAMSLAGLNTVNLSTLNTFQQFVLFLLILMGSAIFVSAFVVHVRRRAFERKFRDVAMERRRQRRSRSRSRGRTWSFRRRSLDTSFTTSTQDDKKSNSAYANSTAPENTVEPIRTIEEKSPARPETPPERRGEPEMNGISSATGEQLNEFAISDSESEFAASGQPQQSITFRGDTRFAAGHPATSPGPPKSVRRPMLGFLNMQGVGARPESSLRLRTPTITDEQMLERPPVLSAKLGSGLDWLRGSTRGWTARNSQFHGLSDKEREKLGGYEYRAVQFLAWVVPAYFILWQLLGCLGCAAWVAYHRSEIAQANGLNPWWVGAFNAVSAFNNSGMSLLDANMTAFQNACYLLITMSLLILAGNTCYPIFLRLIVWCMWKTINNLEDEVWQERARTLRFLLDHPRRCYTNMFPAQHTWWLLVAVIVLNGIDWAAFEILNIGNVTLNDSLSVGLRVIDGLFQAFAVRSGGFYVVTIPNLRIGLLVLYVIMMYISVYPVVITMRNSNVYEERSLGIYAEDEPQTDQTAIDPSTDKVTDHPVLRHARTLLATAHGGVNAQSNAHFVGQQLRAQLSHDAWIIAVALFLIMIIESSQFESNPAVFSVFNFLFEIVSAYGCVGISVGVPWAAYSFCGTWHTLSKLILCVVMLRGRHRGLPVAIDKAVLLPGEEMGMAEEEDGRIRLARTRSMGTIRGEEV
ncbi:Hypothetical protein R9X50_00787700 [Acrodontium crateriforme]|uniref:Potassium transport protein n=1 Tax=Acrodontium crateriforme TaxID=150365 RepID=A0AAQ3RB27_9PEZI|nr:Hypothetical protein R9X50_00787700 [Acrodontium crateriforme]